VLPIAARHLAIRPVRESEQRSQRSGPEQDEKRPAQCLMNDAAKLSESGHDTFRKGTKQL
jgi:hypothetical protein